MVVFVPEAVALKSVLLHLVVVEGTDCVNIRSGCQLLHELLGIVELEHLLDAVKVLSDVVLVLEDAKGLVDLPLHCIFKININYINSL